MGENAVRICYYLDIVVQYFMTHMQFQIVVGELNDSECFFYMELLSCYKQAGCHFLCFVDNQLIQKYLVMN